MFFPFSSKQVTKIDLEVFSIAGISKPWSRYTIVLGTSKVALANARA
jgi:hypothetical protein